MQHLFAVRHGKTGEDRRLNKDGAWRISETGEKIKDIIGDSSVYHGFSCS